MSSVGVGVGIGVVVGGSFDVVTAPENVWDGDGTSDRDGVSRKETETVAVNVMLSVSVLVSDSLPVFSLVTVTVRSPDSEAVMVKLLEAVNSDEPERVWDGSDHDGDLDSDGE